MKVTYLVFENGIGSALRVATKEEWDRIMEDNRGISTDKRRYFIKDCFEDGNTIDCLYYEASKADFDKWHAEKQRYYRRHESDKNIAILSLDISTCTEDGCISDILTDGVDWENKIIDSILIKELRVKLAGWRDWANELLNYYLTGEQMDATKILAKKHGVSEQIIRRRKRELEAFLKKFLRF